MHYFWLNGSLGDMEETYLYHKVESMRLVNEHLGDPIGSTSDSCIYLIAALALAEVCCLAQVVSSPEEYSVHRIRLGFHCWL